MHSHFIILTVTASEYISYNRKPDSNVCFQYFDNFKIQNKRQSVPGSSSGLLLRNNVSRLFANCEIWIYVN